jgi:hypothetical protein
MGMSLRQVEAAVRTAHPDGRVPVSTMSYIFRGLRFPEWYQVEEIIPALGGNLEEWRAKWVAMARSTELFKTWVDHVENPNWWKEDRAAAARRASSPDT